MSEIPENGVSIEPGANICTGQAPSSHVFYKVFGGLSNCNIALLALDDGARAAIMPLAAYTGFVPVEINQSCENGVHELLLPGQYHGLVMGTSDSLAARRIESQVVGLANSAGIPVVAIEDYPGNYHPADGTHVDVVIVDSEFARSLAMGRQPLAPPDIWVRSPVRYDALRLRSQQLREHVSKHWRADSTRWLLWAGQPETEDSLETMKRFLPALSSARDVKLLFKAHPRDARYQTGDYFDLLGSAQLDFLDLTGGTLESCMEYAPRVVLTQFSSLGVEAGFYGIPTVNILYPDVGARRLAEKKGYNIPPWASEGGAFVVTDTAGQDKALDAAINSEMERTSVIQRFDSYFFSAVPAGPALAEIIKQYCVAWRMDRSGVTA